jgi:hypothetical protein
LVELSGRSLLLPTLDDVHFGDSVARLSMDTTASVSRHVTGESNPRPHGAFSRVAVVVLR